MGLGGSEPNAALKAKTAFTDGNVLQRGTLRGKGRLCVALQQINTQESSAFSSSLWLGEIQEATFVFRNIRAMRLKTP